MKHRILKIFFLSAMAVCTLTAQAADKKVTGTVTDNEGEPLIGATVQVAGTSTGISTDIEGNYTLTVPVGKTIKVSYIGYKPAQDKVTEGKDVYDFVLSPDATSLDDVVVVGYGVQKRSEVTGSISTVKGDQIRDFSVNSVADALSGMSAGVSVTKSTGSPGEAPDILIRGAGSVNGMPPLYIVDGVKQAAGFNFNMRDVESIEVLKDAGSCAIYGAEAAGGVILVTTKRGTAGKPSLTLTARYGFRKVNTDIKLMNRDQFIQAKAYSGVDILAYEGVTSADELPDIDWMKEMYDTGHEQEYMLALSGGSDKIKYYVSGGYYSEKGTYIDSSADRWSMRVNVDYNINRYLSVGTSSYGSVQKSNPTRSGTIYTNAVPFRTVPTWDPYDADGNFSQAPSYINGPNLVGSELTYHKKGKDYGANFLGYVNVNIIPDMLVLRLNGAYKGAAYDSRIFSEAYDFRSVSDPAFMESTAGTSTELTGNATLTFDKTWKDVWNLRVMVGTEANKYDAYGNYIRAIDFPVDMAWSLNLSSNTSKEARDYPGVGRALSFFGRVNFNYDGRYFLTANFRRDGSDRFGKKNRWGNFPSVNVMWRASEEKFIKENLHWLSDLKVRGSYGILGNDGISQFLYARSFVGDRILYNFGGTNEVSGWGVFNVPNPDIKWEEVHQGDFGIDLGFFNNQLTFSYDYYNRQTRDMLYNQVVPLGSGINEYWEGAVVYMPINIGKVLNTGHEIAINWRQTVADFTYGVGFNASWNHNEIQSLGDNNAPITSADGINRTEEGHSIAQLWGYKAVGIFQTQEQVDEYNAKAQAAGMPWYWKEKTGVGDLIFSDVNRETGEHQGYVNADCQDFIGNPWPKMTYGLNITAAWKGFDLALQFQGAAGFEIYNQVKMYTQRFGDDGNTTMDIYKNSFFGENGLTDQPRVTSFENGTNMGDVSENFTTTSSFWVEKGDYLKLKNLVFGYTLPQHITRKAAMERVRFYFSASNLFTITKYSGIDPEIAGTSTSAGSGTSMTARGVDTYNRYIPSRLFSFGLDLEFK